MKAARVLRWARLTTGLSQRALAEKAGVPQSTIGRIEACRIDPRSCTLSRLLRACGYDLEAEPLLGQGVDRTLIREMLVLSPKQRVATLVQGVRSLKMIDEARQRRQQRDRSRQD